jgi:two-component system phosphate regulon sensor histidine kinase PhoR
LISANLQGLWRRTLLRLCGLVAVTTGLGLWLGQPLLGFALGVSIGLVGQMMQLGRLENWLLQKDRELPQTNTGSWAVIYRRFDRLTRRGRKRKRKLSQLLKQSQKAIAALPDAAVILDEDGQTVWFNQATTRLLGLKGSRDIGLPITQLLRHPQFVMFLAGRETAANALVHFPSPVDSSITLEARIVPYGKKQQLLLAADISELRRLEQMRRDFAANASHELRTPLTVIVGYLESLQDSDPPPHWRQPLQTLQQQSGRMMQIIDDLLLLSRLENDTEAIKPRAVAVGKMLQEISDDARALSAEQNHRIELRLETTTLLNGVREELRSAFANLIFNAVWHTPAGSAILIRWYDDADGLYLAVADDGPGIPAQHLPRLTERFYRVDRGRQRRDNRQGTGLGLAIVKHVMQRHGGQLRIDSEIGEGSCFYCDFPVECGLSEAANDAVEAKPATA